MGAAARRVAYPSRGVEAYLMLTGGLKDSMPSDMGELVRIKGLSVSSWSRGRNSAMKGFLATAEGGEESKGEREGAGWREAVGRRARMDLQHFPFTYQIKYI